MSCDDLYSCCCCCVLGSNSAISLQNVWNVLALPKQRLQGFSASRLPTLFLAITLCYGRRLPDIAQVFQIWLTLACQNPRVLPFSDKGIFSSLCYHGGKWETSGSLVNCWMLNTCCHLVSTSDVACVAAARRGRGGGRKARKGKGNGAPAIRACVFAFRPPIS